MKKFLQIILLFILTTRCTLNNNDIKKYRWHYQSGYKLKTNTLVFCSYVFKLSNDTIYFCDTAKALLKNTSKGLFGKADVIQIQSLKTDSIGTYANIGLMQSQDTMITIEIKQVDTQEPPAPPAPPKK